MQEFDFIVIGGGSGGLAAARRAAGHGARTLLVEAALLGGTCVNVGCVPKKISWYAATFAELVHDAPDYGFELAPGSFDLGRLRRARDAYLARLREIYARNLELAGIERKQGFATLVDASTIDVAGERFRAPHLLLALGGAPRVPAIPGAELGITSDGFFELERLPARPLVVGGGYVGVELAGILRALGARVTLVLRGRELLKCFDPMVGTGLAEEMTRAGVEIVLDFEGTRLARGAEGLELAARDGRTLSADLVLWAIGRSPATRRLGLEAVGVRLDQAELVEVDAFQTTSVPGIYAVGDATNLGPHLTPVAVAAGRKLADRLFGGEPEARLDYTDIASVVFSHPPVGSVGLSEPEARERFGEAVRVYTQTFTSLYHGVTRRKTLTRLKLVVVGADERVVGIHALGIGSDELIQGFAVALKLGAKKADLDRTLAIHPTAAEELVTMR